MEKKDLPDLLYNTIKSLKGRSSMMAIFREFWRTHASKLKDEDELFYTWNYDIRWAATQLRKEGRMKPACSQENPHGLETSPKGIWEINQ